MSIRFPLQRTHTDRQILEECADRFAGAAFEYFLEGGLDLAQQSEVLDGSNVVVERLRDQVEITTSNLIRLCVGDSQRQLTQDCLEQRRQGW